MRKWCCGVVVVVGLAACGNDPVVLDPTPTSASATTQAVAIGDARVPETVVAASSSTPPVAGGNTGTPVLQSTTPGTSPATKPKATTPPSVLNAPVADPVVVSAEGIGDVRLGDDAQDALAQLFELLGDPAQDSGWGPNQSPCETLGTRSRAVEWAGATALFATGPTETVPDARDHLSAFLIYQDSPLASRLTIDGVAVMGRSVAALQGDIVGLSAFNSEIEGPLWVINSAGAVGLTGNLDVDGNISSVRAGLLCID
jgi:hypothetical protein